MLSPPSESPVLVTVIFDKFAVMLPETLMVFSSAVVEVNSPLAIVSFVVISFAEE